MCRNFAFGHRQLNEAAPAIVLVYADFADIFTFAVRTYKHRLHLLSVQDDAFFPRFNKHIGGAAHLASASQI